MTRYVALLRGINVGGVRITMADLREVFETLGYRNVRTVLASGNVVFDADLDDPPAAKATIEQALSARFGYRAYVFVLAQQQVAAVVEACPFTPRDDRHAYAVFVATDDALTHLLATGGTLDPATERISRGDGVVYWEVEKGRTIDSCFGKVTGAARYQPTTTTRNLRTLRKLV